MIDLNMDLIAEAIASIMGVTYQPRDLEYDRAARELAEGAPVRSLELCAGCPHRGTFWAIKQALTLDGRNGFAIGDVGCYSMGSFRSGFYQSRISYVMGSGTGISSGMGNLRKFGFTQPVITLCGDSTFYHSAIPALINSIYNQANSILLILDNNAIAMTGGQPHPGTGMNVFGEIAPVVDMEALCRAMGAHVEVCDAFDTDNTIGTLLRLMQDNDGTKVVIMRHECELLRARREKKNPYKVYIDPERCIGEDCGCNRLCTREFACPGLIWDETIGKSRIDELACKGCGLCVDICPQGAIIREATST